MITAGIIILLFCLASIATATQILFLKSSKRLIWRAFVPYWLRKMLLPDDPIHLNSFEIFEEYSAVMIAGAFMMLPVIAVSTMGFVEIF